jgi:hydroxymethylbilane synthase
VLERASYKDIFVYKNEAEIRDWQLQDVVIDSPLQLPGTIATSSIRRIAQWRHRYPNHGVENLRGNVNTRLRKVQENNWHGAIFAAAGLERINLRPENAIDLDWMLPAPAQGAIMVVCRKGDDRAFKACQVFHHEPTAVCVKAERDFLRTLMGGCSTPISALAEIQDGNVLLRGNICTPDGKQKVEMDREMPFETAQTLGVTLANELLNQPFVTKIVQQVQNGKI